MNLEEIRTTIATMQRLQKMQREVRASLIKFLCGTEANYKKFKDTIGDVFGLDKLDWKHSLENLHGKEWANVFAFLSSEPTEDQILENLFTLTKREPQIYGKMLSEFNADKIEEKIEAAEYVAKYQFPIGHHGWVFHRINTKNAAIVVDPQLFEKVERTLRNIWSNVLDYAIMSPHRNWMSEYEFNQRFMDAYKVMMSEQIPPCMDLSEQYISALAWMDEYEEWKEQHPNKETSMTMEELENLCSDN